MRFRQVKYYKLIFLFSLFFILLTSCNSRPNSSPNSSITDLRKRGDAEGVEGFIQKTNFKTAFLSAKTNEIEKNLFRVRIYTVSLLNGIGIELPLEDNLKVFLPSPEEVLLKSGLVPDFIHKVSEDAGSATYEISTNTNHASKVSTVLEFTAKFKQDDLERLDKQTVDLRYDIKSFGFVPVNLEFNAEYGYKAPKFANTLPIGKIVSACSRAGKDKHYVSVGYSVFEVDSKSEKVRLLLGSSVTRPKSEELLNGYNLNLSDTNSLVCTEKDLYILDSGRLLKTSYSESSELSPPVHLVTNIQMSQGNVSDLKHDSKRGKFFFLNKFPYEDPGIYEVGVDGIPTLFISPDDITSHTNDYYHRIMSYTVDETTGFIYLSLMSVYNNYEIKIYEISLSKTIKEIVLSSPISIISVLSMAVSGKNLFFGNGFNALRYLISDNHQSASLQQSMPFANWINLAFHSSGSIYFFDTLALRALDPITNSIKHIAGMKNENLNNDTATKTFGSISAVAVTKNEKLYVADQFTNKVSVINLKNNLISDFVLPGPRVYDYRSLIAGNSMRLAVSGNHLYLATNHSIFELTNQGLQILFNYDDLKCLEGATFLNMIGITAIAATEKKIYFAIRTHLFSYTLDTKKVELMVVSPVVIERIAANLSKIFLMLGNTIYEVVSEPTTLPFSVQVYSFSYLGVFIPPVTPYYIKPFKVAPANITAYGICDNAQSFPASISLSETESTLYVACDNGHIKKIEIGEFNSMTSLIGQDSESTTCASTFTSDLDTANKSSLNLGKICPAKQPAALFVSSDAIVFTQNYQKKYYDKPFLGNNNVVLLKASK